MAQQNINQYVYQKYKLNLIYDGMDMSLTSDERDYDEEVLFSPYLISQTHGNKLPIYFDTNNLLTTTQPELTFKNYNYNNIFVSQNYYNPDNNNFCNYSSSTLCDIGLTGIDNGLVDVMTGMSLNYTNGLYVDDYKFNRFYYDRRMKMFQVTGHTGQYNIFSGRPQNTLYEIVSVTDPQYGYYHELYGGFYQGFYKLFGYDYDILPERMNKGWSVELLLRPRLCDQYPILSGETTLNLFYPNNKNTFFYFGTRAENKFYHYADGSPKCLTGYTRVTTPLADCLQTCACCSYDEVVTTTTTNQSGYTPDYVLETITNSRCIFVYPPRSKDGKHDPHVNYGCDVCGGDPYKRITCGCSCGEQPCDTCGWECRSHKCFVTKQPTPTPTPTPTQTPSCEYPTPVCTPSCTTCKTCTDCTDCSTPGGIKSIEDTCEKDPLWDSLSNALSVRFSGDPRNPKICVRVLKLTGTCETSGTTTVDPVFTTGYTVVNYCSPNGVYDYCEKRNVKFLDIEKWLQVDVVWSRYTYLDFCDLKYFGGLGDISEVKYLDSLANDTVKLISPPITSGTKTPQTVEIVNLNKKWLDDTKYRMGRLKIYVNGKRFFTIEDFEEIIPRALNTDKEKQVGVPFNISWGGGTQGLHENLTFSSCTGLTSNYIQDPECFPDNILSGTTFSKLKTNILIEQNFAGTFEGGVTQFRMYTEPLTSSEVKHNFNILKNTFDMFDPDCPNCETKYCETNDLTYTIDDYTTTTTTVTNEENILMGRIYVQDVRDQKYLIQNHFSGVLKNKKITQRYWDDNGWWGNQGYLPHCVGYAWAHWLEDGPIPQSGVAPIIHPSVIYQNAQKLDEWPGENYDGTSVRGGVKFLQKQNKVSSYYWAYDLNTLIQTVLNVGPVVVGTNWYNGMFYPDRNGVIRIGGRLAGGHAYVINGVDVVKKQFRIKNSWGKNWGREGRVFISFNDMTRLIKEQGEICLATEIKS